MRFFPFALLIAVLLTACGGDSSTETGNNQGTTTEECDPAVVCDGLECGQPDGCDVDCGTCESGTCESGMCVCEPQCEGRACGSDGCGGTCGECSGDDVCNDMSGACAATCTPVTCDDMAFECGESSDGCGGTISCGTCAAGNCSENVCDNTTPTFAFLDLDESRNVRGPAFDITWQDDDPEEDASIAIYYDTDNAGADGQLLADGISEDDETDALELDISMLPRGELWFYAQIDDGAGPVVVYANAPINKTAPPCEEIQPNMVFDVESVEVTLDFTLNGAPLSAMNTTQSDTSEIQIRRGPVSFNLGDARSGAVPYTFDIEPGTYEIYLNDRFNVQGGNWPDGGGTVGEITFDADGTYTFDIETIQRELNLSVNGVPFSEANFPDRDRVWAVLFDETASYGVDIFGEFNSTTFVFDPVSFPQTVTLPKRAFSLLFFTDGNAIAPEIPSFTQDYIDPAQAGPADTDVAIKPVDVTFVIDGVDLATVTPQTTDQADLMFVRPGGQISAGGLDRVRFSTAPGNLPQTISIAPGQYDVYYEKRSPNGAHLPAGFTQVASDVTIDGGTFEVALTSAPLTIDVLIEGAALDATNVDLDDSPRIELATPDFKLNSTLLSATNSSLTYKLLPGEYDVRLWTRDPGPTSLWPSVQFAPLATVDPVATPTYTLDVTTSQVTFNVTFNGQPLSGSNTSPFSGSGLFGVRKVGAGGDRELGDTFDSSTNTVVDTFTMRLPDGEYRLFYDGQSGSMSQTWPLLFGFEYDRFTVSGDTTVPIDVQTASSSVTMTLNGAVPIASDAGAGATVALHASPGNYRYDYWRSEFGIYVPIELDLFRGHHYYFRALTNSTASWPVITGDVAGCVVVP